MLDFYLQVSVYFLSRIAVNCQSTLLGILLTEHADIITKRGITKNGSLLYTIVPMHEVREQFYERQLHELELAAEYQRVQKELAKPASA